MTKKLLYRIREVKEAKEVTKNYLKSIQLDKVTKFGLPEIDDRYHIWRVPLLSNENEPIGEIVIDAISTLINEKKSTNKKVLESRLLGRKVSKKNEKKLIENGVIPKISFLRNTLGYGDCEDLLAETPIESVDLIFTSPPYFNARPEYSEYLTYEEYLLKIRKIIHQCHRVLNEGRFFVINISPILIRRTSRKEASRRIAVPFDFHRIFIEEGFEFIDDIIWVKPEGAGWATSRGRRFAADRNPLQYKPAPITEYVLVYRKKTERLIDWHIRKHPDQQLVSESKINDDYEKTNVWRIRPAHSPKHPAIFPIELAERVIKYYSFKNDVVLDPFAGIGTVGKAAIKLGRRFVLFELDPDYIKTIQEEMFDWLKTNVNEVNLINLTPIHNKSPFLEL